MPVKCGHLGATLPPSRLSLCPSDSLVHRTSSQTLWTPRSLSLSVLAFPRCVLSLSQEKLNQMWGSLEGTHFIRGAEIF